MLCIRHRNRIMDALYFHRAEKVKIGSGFNETCGIGLCQRLDQRCNTAALKFHGGRKKFIPGIPGENTRMIKLKINLPEVVAGDIVPVLIALEFLHCGLRWNHTAPGNQHTFLVTDFRCNGISILMTEHVDSACLHGTDHAAHQIPIRESALLSGIRRMPCIPLPAAGSNGLRHHACDMSVPDKIKTICPNLPESETCIFNIRNFSVCINQRCFQLKQWKPFWTP